MPTPASATPGCVTKNEYTYQVKRGHTQRWVRDRFDTAGAEIDRWARWEFNEAAYERDTDNWWADEPQTWQYADPYGADWWLYEADTDSWWANEPQYSDYSIWAVDTVRSYKKCKGFDRGKGRVGVNFDNYYHRASGMRVYKKVRNNPWTLSASMGYARTGVPKAK